VLKSVEKFVESCCNGRLLIIVRCLRISEGRIIGVRQWRTVVRDRNTVVRRTRTVYNSYIETILILYRYQYDIKMISLYNACYSATNSSVWKVNRRSFRLDLPWHFGNVQKTKWPHPRFMPYFRHFSHPWREQKRQQGGWANIAYARDKPALNRTPTEWGLSLRLLWTPGGLSPS
jgi:hypothetical protein